MYGFTGDKMLYEARRRDFLRSKLSVGKRLEAKVRADKIVDAHDEAQKKKADREDTLAVRANRDSAMETVIKDLKDQGSLKKLVL